MARAVIIAGICSAILFIIVGLGFALQLYGDGAIFSYAVAVQDAWAFHWHNIAARTAVYVLCLAPAQAFVALTGNASGGIVVYGLLWFASPLVGLIATYFADRSPGRIIFTYACFSAAVLCPLVFGFPTEMWLAQALFWPALAVAHYAPKNIGGTVLVFFLLLALVFTHEGAVIFGVAIVATLLLRGRRDAAFLRAAGALVAVLAIWAVVKLAVPPDDYISSVLSRAAHKVFDLGILWSGLVLLLTSAIASYGVLYFVLARIVPAKAHFYAAAIVAGALAVYWLGFDQSLHSTNRYFMRTVLVVATPLLGIMAALHINGRLASAITPIMTRAIIGGFALVLLAHVVETAKFVTAWTRYKAAVTALATGAASDPALGDPRFVSSDRIDPSLNRLSWNSTTPFLSVILAKFAPARLVVDPSANYFWLSCESATANFNASRAVPASSRDLIRTHACRHRGL